MTQPTLSPVLTATSSAELLQALKNLKNSVIGNTWKKVEVAENEPLLRLFISLLSSREMSGDTKECVIETAVIIGALANVGSLTIRPLLQVGTPSHLLMLIRSLSTTPTPPVSLNRLLPALLRALRNLLITTADLVWGHMWGVGAEKKVVSTGLVGETAGVKDSNGKGKAVVGKGRSWKIEAARALGSCFEQANLSCLMNLVCQNTDTQVTLPLCQLLCRLIALPSHREAIARWTPPAPPSPGPSTLQNLRPTTATSPPFIVTHLVTTIYSATASPSYRKTHAKLLEAVLDLLAAVIKGQPDIAILTRRWHSELGIDSSHHLREATGVVDCLVILLAPGPTAVRIASANCLTNIIKADKGTHTQERLQSAAWSLKLLDVIAELLETEGPEERVKLCFVLAALVSDNGDLQKCAFDRGIPGKLIIKSQDLDRKEEQGDIGKDLASRSKEAILLALASLAFQCDPTRTLLAETSPPFLPLLHKSLSHPSYGVRAAACQLCRALSRTIAILRTSLIDSGVGAEVIETLKREVARHTTARSEIVATMGEEDLDERAYTVEVAATATICNLVTVFSPLKAALIKDGGVEMLCALTNSPYEPLALNSLWAIKNLMYQESEPFKSTVMSTFGWSTLRSLVNSPTRTILRIQALEIVQNLCADAAPAEVGRYLEQLGEGDFIAILAAAAKADQAPELKIPALYVIANLALGNEKTRNTITSRLDLIEILSEAINDKVDTVKIPAMRALRYLLESNIKTRRPRQGVLDLLQPYQLKPRLKELAEGSPSLDVCQAAVGLLDVLDRGREGAAGQVGSVPR